MSADSSTIKAVSTLLAADAGVSPDLRDAVLNALNGGGAVCLKDAARVLGVGRTTLWRMRKKGVRLERVKSRNRKSVMVTVDSVTRYLPKA